MRGTIAALAVLGAIGAALALWPPVEPPIETVVEPLATGASAQVDPFVGDEQPYIPPRGAPPPRLDPLAGYEPAFRPERQAGPPPPSPHALGGYEPVFVPPQPGPPPPE